MNSQNLLDEIILVDRLDYTTILNQELQDIANEIAVWFVSHTSISLTKSDDIKSLEIDDFTATLSKQRYNVIKKETDSMSEKQFEAFVQYMEEIYKNELENKYKEL